MGSHKLLFEAMQFKEGLILLALITLLVVCSPARSSQKSQELSIDRHRRYKCFLAKDPGPCRGMFRRFYFNKETSQCEQFIYGGCDGNANRFGSIDDCQKACFSNNICSLSKDPGPCRGMFRRFYFNKETSQCEQFIYGGCDGNANRFGSIADCQNACFTGKPESEIDRCSLPSDPGRCKMWIPSFYFNRETAKCEKFIYGGCNGNANRFGSIADCQTACFTGKPGKPDYEIDSCSLPKDSGICLALMPMFYFNTETSQCEGFTYGGCSGNANRFRSIADCQNACSWKT